MPRFSSKLQVVIIDIAEPMRLRCHAHFGSGSTRKTQNTAWSLSPPALRSAVSSVKLDSTRVKRSCMVDTSPLTSPSCVVAEANFVSLTATRSWTLDSFSAEESCEPTETTELIGLSDDRMRRAFRVIPPSFMLPRRLRAHALGFLTNQLMGSLVLDVQHQRNATLALGYLWQRSSALVPYCTLQMCTDGCLHFAAAAAAREPAGQISFVNAESRRPAHLRAGEGLQPVFQVVHGFLALMRDGANLRAVVVASGLRMAIKQPRSVHVIVSKRSSKKPCMPTASTRRFIRKTLQSLYPVFW